MRPIWEVAAFNHCRRPYPIVWLGIQQEQSPIYAQVVFGFPKLHDTVMQIVVKPLHRTPESRRSVGNYFLYAPMRAGTMVSAYSQMADELNAVSAFSPQQRQGRRVATGSRRQHRKPTRRFAARPLRLGVFATTRKAQIYGRRFGTKDLREHERLPAGNGQRLRIHQVTISHQYGRSAFPLRFGVLPLHSEMLCAD